MKLISYLTTTLVTITMVMGICTVLLLHWSAFGWKALSVPTGSMRPTMPPGSLVLVHRVPDNTLQVGDVITYANPLNPTATISHRIIRIYTKNHVLTFITKGDANASPDVPVLSGFVEGRVAWHIPELGGFLMWSKTLPGIAVLVYLPCLLIILEEIGRLREYYAHAEPYRMYGYMARQETGRHLSPKIGIATGLFLVTFLSLNVAGTPTEALLGSGTVKLTNTLRVATPAPPTQCSGNVSNTTSVTVTNTTTQQATSGNVQSTGGTTSSGNASNSSTTNIGVTVTNC